MFAPIVSSKLSKNVQFSKQLWILVDQLQLQKLHVSSENIYAHLYTSYNIKSKFIIKFCSKNGIRKSQSKVTRLTWEMPVFVVPCFEKYHTEINWISSILFL